MKTNRRNQRAARRLFRACVTGGMLSDARVQQVATRLAASHRRGWLPVLCGFVRLVRLDIERRTALVESAVPLPSGMRDGITTHLEDAYGQHTMTTFALNPALLAGIRIRVGSQIVDGSVQARLAALEAGL